MKQFDAQYRGVTMACYIDDAVPGELSVDLVYPNEVVPAGMKSNYRFTCKPGTEQNALASVYKSLCSKIDEIYEEPSGIKGEDQTTVKDGVASSPQREQYETKEDSTTSDVGQKSIKVEPTSLQRKSDDKQQKKGSKKKLISTFTLVSFIVVFLLLLIPKLTAKPPVYQQTPEEKEQLEQMYEDYKAGTSNSSDANNAIQSEAQDYTVEQYFDENPSELQGIKDAMNSQLTDEYNSIDISASGNQLVITYVFAYDLDAEQEKEVSDYLAEEMSAPSSISTFKNEFDAVGVKDPEIRFIYTDLGGTTLYDQTF